MIGVGVSPAATELHRIVSSNPGAEKTNVNAIGVAPMFFPLIQVFASKVTPSDAWVGRQRQALCSPHVAADFSSLTPGAYQLAGRRGGEHWQLFPVQVQ